MFSFFAQLWTLAFFVHYSEEWKRPIITLIGLGLVLAISKTKNRALVFFGSLSFYIVYYAVKLPFLANHSNYYLLISIFIWFWMLGSWFKHKKLSEAKLLIDFIPIRKTLCLSLFVLYFMAGFHKLNADFLNPEVSCASNFFLRYTWAYGIPATVFPKALLTFSPYLVLSIELIGALFLLVPTLQIYGVLMFVGLHSYLAPLSFYDFASICYAALLCFLPLSVFQGEENLKRAKKGMTALVGIMIAGALISKLFMHLEWNTFIKPDYAQGFYFLIGSFYFMRQLYLNLKAEGYKIYKIPGVNLFKFHKDTPRWMHLLPLFLFIYAGTSYLGLRTTGNTSMFSNLRTEGGVSNHLLISSAWQPFDFQKDLVFIKSVHHKYAYYKKSQPAPNMWMTSFELRRIVEMWKSKDASVPMELIQNGELKVYDDIVTSKDWSEPLPWVLKKTMMFRPIQDKAPNRCRW